MENRRNIIACRIFENEINSIVSEKDELTFHWIAAALHANPDKMKTAISKALSNIEPTETHIDFLFGNGCHPDMCAIAQQHNVKLPTEKNCIHAFRGSQRAMELEQNRTMIITPGWLDAWQGIVEGLGWDEVDVRINMGRYDRIVLLDPGVAPIDDMALIEFYDQIQVPIETMEINLDYFERWVKSPHA